MTRLTDLEYLKLNKFQALLYKLKLFFCAIPAWFKRLFARIVELLRSLGGAIMKELRDIGYTFAKGNWAVKLSFFIFGFGNLFYGQILRGVLFLLFEVVFIAYMVLPQGGGFYWLDKVNFFQTGNTVGNVQQSEGVTQIPVDIPGVGTTIIDQKYIIPGDDSARVLFYGLLTVLLIVAFIITWRMQVKQCRICMDITKDGKKIRSGKDDLKSLLDDQFHKTLLALPLVGILLFTVVPIIYMILIAFTNYGDWNNVLYDGVSRLFEWVGFYNFKQLGDFGTNGLGRAFGDILIWTLTWAFFATFSNYFLGMFIAMLINKKGIKLKKFWRTVLVMTIAIPQFVSLLYVSHLFDGTGIIGKLLDKIPLIHNYLTTNHYTNLWNSPVMAKVLLIVINIWIGIPYIMLMVTGILMNIPNDLYESARIDGATPWQQYSKITLPYVLFVTGPYLLTSFVGNLNNFNVIYLLTGGNPLNTEVGAVGSVTVGHTDLLVTLLYKITLGASKTEYYTASIIGILVFLVVAILSLIVYNVIPSTKNEEDYK